MPTSEPRGQGRAPGCDSADAQWLGFNAVAAAAGCQASRSRFAGIHPIAAWRAQVCKSNLQPQKCSCVFSSSICPLCWLTKRMCCAVSRYPRLIYLKAITYSTYAAASRLKRDDPADLQQHPPSPSPCCLSSKSRLSNTCRLSASAISVSRAARVCIQSCHHPHEWVDFPAHL